MDGWIKLHRKIAMWQWASSPNHMTIFMQLLLRANHKPTKWRKEIIAPGQILTGRKQLMEWTGLTEMQVRKCLNDLESTSEIIRKRSAKYSIISISNWKTYQSDNREISVEQPANNQQTTTSKNANNAKNEKNIIYCEAFSGDQSTPESETSNTVQNILTALNTICLKNFRPTSANVRFINARLKEGYNLEDFKAVIQLKHDQWSNNPQMSAYLRPSTIFGTKFDGYLEEARKPFKTKIRASDDFGLTNDEIEEAKKLGII